MKRVVNLSLVAVLFLGVFACGSPKPYYKTAVGKKKQEYYNDIQFGRNQNPKKKF